MKKKIGIMQPYLFPYLGYYALVNYTDYFVFFDTPQFIKKGWINRNRILDASGNACYFTVPIEKAALETSILDTRICQSVDWKDRIRGQFSIYKKRAPYYKEVMELLEDVLSYTGNQISELAIDSVGKVCSFIGINKKMDIFSELKIDIPTIKHPDEWALYISKELGYEVYVNPPGGMTFFRNEIYKEHKVELEFLKIELIPYVQRIGKFVEGLSILDVLMFCKSKEVLSMLDQYTIIKDETI